MSKLGCICGHVIVDQTDSLPYKAELLRADREEVFYDRVEALFASMRIAMAEGRLSELLHEAYGSWLPVKEDVFFIEKLSSLTGEFFTTMYECEACGRLWVQRPNDPHFISYSPDGGRPQRILSSE